MIKVTIELSSKEDVQKLMKLVKDGTLAHLGVVDCELVKEEEVPSQACPVCEGETYGYDFCSDYCACIFYHGDKPSQE